MKQNWHAESIDQIIKTIQTTKQGLTQQEADQRIQQYGKNILPKSQTKTVFQVFLGQFKDPIIIILAITTIVSLILGELIDAIFILLVILADAILGTYQEYKAEKSAESLEELVKVMTTVLRNGKKIEINSEEITIGDIVLIEPGNKIPADLRLIDCTNLTIDESFLTGESVAEVKSTQTIDKNTPLADRTNMAFAGSTVMTGRGKGIVVAIANHTEIGSIANKVLSSDSTKTPLVIRMENFTKQISYAVAIIAIILSFVLYLKGYAVREIFFSVVALSVSAIPEGLPIAMTVALSIATNRMAKKNVIVRKLNAVESLGSCTVIASDKTGTLTINQQTAKRIVLANKKTFEIEGIGYNDQGTILDENKKKTDQANEIIQLGMLNNEANLEQKNGQWTQYGDAMDVALLALGKKANFTTMQQNIIASIPYESENKYAAVLYQDKKKTYLTAKGSTETILDFCTTMKGTNKKIKINKKQILEQQETLAKLGYRVLAFCQKETKPTKTVNPNDLKGSTFIGLIGFIDPIRKEAKASIQECKEAGIKVIMITGDHPTTAQTIATDLGLITTKEQVATGNDLEHHKQLGEQEFDQFIKKTKVYSRVTPMQKLDIIESFKRQGEFIAVTGDGVNDAPAMKAANIGIAMGSGTDVAKETGSMILTDDNFTSLVSGIEEGRYAYNNVRKVIYLLISCGIGEVLFFLFAILFNLPLPLLAIQLLWLNLVTDGIQDVALAFEKVEPGIMKQKPRKTTEHIFNKTLIEETVLSGVTIACIVFITWFFLIKILRIDIVYARTYILLLMVFMQNIHAFNCRSEQTSTFKIPFKNNPFIVLGVFATIALQIIVIEIPFTSHVLQAETIPLSHMVYIFLASLPLLFIMEGYKYIKRKENKTI